MTTKIKVNIVGITNTSSLLKFFTFDLYYKKLITFPKAYCFVNVMPCIWQWYMHTINFYEHKLNQLLKICFHRIFQDHCSSSCLLNYIIITKYFILFYIFYFYTMARWDDMFLPNNYYSFHPTQSLTNNRGRILLCKSIGRK